jgi:hypothetical protein
MQMSVIQSNLNEAWPDIHQIDNVPLEPIDNSAISESGEVRAVFRNLDRELIGLIDASQVVVGCVAWLTHDDILRALARVSGGVSIVVQKEDFLRPDADRASQWKEVMRMRYAAIPMIESRYLCGGVVAGMNTCGDQTVQSVRCVGNHNRDRRPAFPRMHNKFLVFGEIRHIDEWNSKIVPKAVWTGSFNMTRNATASLENAVVITSPRIVMAYLEEWRQILAISEPLDWTSDWCEPEWRIGT